MSKDIAAVNLWDTATTVNATAAITSSPIAQHWSAGYCSILIILAGSSPSVNITFTVSDSDTGTYYTPTNTYGTSIGAVRSALTSTAWIQFSPAVAPYFKITVTGGAANGADTTVRAKLFYPEEF